MNFQDEIAKIIANYDKRYEISRTRLEKIEILLSKNLWSFRL